MTDETVDMSSAHSAAATAKTLAIGILHVAALSALALAQPLFDLLGKNAEFFVARESRAIDIWLLILVLLAAIPAVVLVMEWIVIRLAPVAYRTLHAAIIGLLGSLFAVPVIKKLVGEPWVVLFLGLIAGAAIGYSYFRLRGFRVFLTWLAPAPLVMAGLFVLATPVSRLVLPRDEALAIDGSRNAAIPVVVVVWDELNVAALMAPDGSVDATTFPNFARLAADGTWYRKASGVSEATTLALPAILDGRMPDVGLIPVASDYPKNLFTLLAPTHELHVREPVTALCPESVCATVASAELGLLERLRSLFSDLRIVYLHLMLPKGLTSDLPPINRTWSGFAANVGSTEGMTRDQAEADFGQVTGTSAIREELAADRVGSVRAFITDLDLVSGRPPFVFLHAVLPHTPYRYARSGRRYRDSGDLYGLEGGKWIEDEWAVTQAHQRYLLQTTVVDDLMGELLDKLDELGIYDDALIITTADHGVGFTAGGLFRGALEDSFAETMSVPMIVKLPGEKAAATSDADVRTIDVLPTVVDVLGSTIDWEVDGVSVRELPSYRGPKEQIRADGTIISVDATLPDLYAVVEAKFARFTSVDGSFYLFAPSASWPTGEQTALLTVAPRSIGEVEVLGLRADGTFHSEGLSPTRIVGTVTFDEPGSLHKLAVAVDGVMVATGPILRANSLGGSFSYFVPEEVFDDGAGRVEIYLVEELTDGVLLSPLALKQLRRYSTSVYQDGNEYLEIDGIGIPIGPGFEGGIDIYEPIEGIFLVAGWAADLDERLLPTEIVITIDGISVIASALNRDRHDVVERFDEPRLLGSGFSFDLALDQVTSAQSVRVFAVAGSEYATELAAP